jgi:UTP--glucose-1-phosphate uridylyltransferase/phosphoglucomutase
MHTLSAFRCPPGHGDIYPSLLGSGMPEKLIADGIKYLT